MSTQASTMVKAIWNGTVIAESDDTIVVEGNHYFPANAVNTEFLKPSDTTTHCHWKGEASYHSLDVGGNENKDAAWYYATPMAEADKLGLKGRIAFWHGVRVE